MLKEGSSYTSTAMVSDKNTAKTVGSGDLDVFATPAMIALMENAAMLAVSKHLEENLSTVGGLIDIVHMRPSKIGETIKATATLKEVDNRKLTFVVTAEDSQGIIGQGKHIRFVVDREKFLSKL